MSKDHKEELGLISHLVQRILDEVVSLESLKKEDMDLLDGAAGFLYALLLIEKNLTDTFPHDQVREMILNINCSITFVVQEILTNC